MGEGLEKEMPRNQGTIDFNAMPSDFVFEEI